MKYDELLNHKSILDCENPKDEEQHGKDVLKMYEKAEGFGKFGAIVKMQPMDKAHKKNKPDYRFVRPEDYMDVVQACDLKNGGDMVVHNGVFGIAVYGQGYTIGLKKEHYLVETLCSFQFLDGKADVEKLEEMGVKELEKAFEKGEGFLGQKDLIKDLRGVKRKDLDALIQDAEERRSGNMGGKGKDKEKGRE